MGLLCLWLSSNGLIWGRTEKTVKNINSKITTLLSNGLHPVKGKLREN